jgi:hypothetical protein
MTQRQILNLLCTYFNGLSLGVPFLAAPLSEAAPDGEYIAFRFGDASRIGTAPERGGPEDDDIIFHWTGTIRMTEVEGTGETIRRVHNLLHTKEFTRYSSGNAFSVHDVSDITDNVVNDGDFWIEQKMATLYVNWYDQEANSTPTIKKISGEYTTDDDEKKYIFEVGTN